MSKLKQLRRYIPYLDVRLNLGFIGLDTQIMTRYMEIDAVTYIMLRWHFFNWSGSFRLYSPNSERLRR